MEPCLLHIETSTQICSVAISKGNDLISYKTVKDKNVHSELLTIFILEILEEAGMQISDLDAVSVSKGPGSFTGLRIGVAVAKGICYGIDIPLISVQTLRSLLNSVSSEYVNDNYLFLSLIDARNGEVYTSIFDHQQNEIMKTDIGNFNFEGIMEFVGAKNLIIIGDEVDKWAGKFKNEERIILLQNILPDARNLISIAYENFKDRKFEDITFFEPLYLRDFKAKIGTKIKNILNS